MKPQTQRAVRQYHRYLGLFFTPAILLFVVSGALQTFRLQEEKGWGGTPPTLFVWLAAVHKDQSPPREKPAAAQGKPMVAEDHHDEDAAPPAKAEAQAQPRVRAPSPLPLKIFVLLMAVGLGLSSLLGATIALTNRATRRSAIVLLAAGAVLPCVLLWV